MLAVRRNSLIRQTLCGVLAAGALATATSCADPSQTLSETRADRRAEPATAVDVTKCSSAVINDGGLMYPDIQEGSVPGSATVRGLLWCSFNDNTRQMVGRSTDATGDVLDRLADITMTRAEAEADCSLAIRTEPVLFALTDQGSYRVALPRNPGCGGAPTAAVGRALDANDRTWLIVETQER